MYIEYCCYKKETKHQRCIQPHFSASFIALDHYYSITCPFQSKYLNLCLLTRYTALVVQQCLACPIVLLNLHCKENTRTSKHVFVFVSKFDANRSQMEDISLNLSDDLLKFESNFEQLKICFKEPGPRSLFPITIRIQKIIELRTQYGLGSDETLVRSVAQAKTFQLIFSYYYARVIFFLSCS